MKNTSVHGQAETAYRASLRLRTRLGSAWLQLQRYWELAEQRRKLALLDEHALHDLGLSRADAILESERAFWDDPLVRQLPGDDAAPHVSGKLLT